VILPQPGRKFILASASPRRRQLLRDARFQFEIDPADINEEDFPPQLSPGEVAEYLAVQKALAVAARHPAHVVLAADTVVALGRQALGKPVDADHARRMIRALGGTIHHVITGVALAVPGGDEPIHLRVSSEIQTRALSDEEIERYVETQAWRGKAGGYGIQDPDPFIVRTVGSLTNIVGLPMEETTRLLAEAGIGPAEA
jgi:septum formation protein